MNLYEKLFLLHPNELLFQYKPGSSTLNIFTFNNIWVFSITKIDLHFLVQMRISILNVLEISRKITA